MSRRLELQAKLEEILGSTNVYFQTPPSSMMRYPCIIYARDNKHTRFADDKPYLIEQRWRITYIDKDPDNREVPNKLLRLPKTLGDRSYSADNLNHEVFNTYF